MKIIHSFFIWFVLTLLFFGIHVAFVSGSCQDDQRSLLLHLNHNLTFSNSNKSTKLVKWNSSTDCCHWEGVKCDEAGLGRVIGLNLSGQAISGGIDNSSPLFSLQYLQNLDLSFNNISASMPSRFSDLTSLISLNLSNAGFKGQIPVEISRMINLTTLDLSITGLYFKGHPLKLENPNLAMLVQNLTQLTELSLDGVNISSSGKEWCLALSPLHNLKSLSLSSCFLSGPFDSSLANLKNLSALRLDGNNFSASVPAFFANFSNLRILRLSSCGLQESFPAKVFQISTLEIIDLSFNQDLQGGLADIIQNASLKTLELRNTNFSGRLPDAIGAHGNLTRVNVAGSKFTGKIPPMDNLTKLVYLDFSSNMFTGQIPSFSNSKKLTYMDLSHNNLSGSISNLNWKGLSDLIYIDLKYNSLSGNIPPSLFTIPSLQNIQFSTNQFAGQISSFSNASSSSLNTLDLSNNSLEGPIPDSIFELRRLIVLTLASNKFNGTIKLDQIQKLVNLTAVDLSYNQLTVDANATNSTLLLSPRMTSLKLASCNLRVFPDIRNLSKLKVLDLSDNHIDGSVPQWIGQVGNGSLSNLNLSRNLLVSVPETLSNLTSLAVLDLHSNRLEGKIPTPPPNASVLDYSDNSFSSSIPQNIGNNLSSIIFFSLSNNSVQGGIPESLCNATYLRVLDFSNNNLNGSIPSCLIESKNLGVLNLRKNNFGGRIPDNFPEKCILQTLDLSGNSLEGKVPGSLISCTTLEVLDIGNNKIHDNFPCLVRNISSLRVLVLRNNKFYGDLMNCPSINTTIHPTGTRLQIVDIALNNFGGELPNSILRSWKAMMGEGNETHDHIKFDFLQFRGPYYQDSITVTSKGLEMQLVKILTIFTSIDVSFNRFEGPIPDGLGRLSALYGLNLSHNAFDGQIPSTLGNLLHLESVDLSSNNLTGEIPQQLARLTFLSFLNLSNNMLVGRIPISTQLQSFSEASFEGNKGLCGAPLRNSCSSELYYIRNENEFNWKLIFRGLGFGIGAGAAVAPLLFWKEANKWYDDRVDKICMFLLPMLGLVYYAKNDWRIGPDEPFEEDTTDVSDDDDDDFEGRYCVFCTKLDITVKHAIHDLRCTCYDSPPLSSSSSSKSSFPSPASQ